MGKIIKIILAVAFFICLTDLPYGYYQFVRFLGMAGFLLLAYEVSSYNNKTEMVIYFCLAILFQPFIKIALGRNLWNIVDIIIGIALLISVGVDIKKAKK